MNAPLRPARCSTVLGASAKRGLVFVALAFAWACSCRGATFTAGNIVVERVGGGGTAGSSTATNVFVD